MKQVKKYYELSAISDQFDHVSEAAVADLLLNNGYCKDVCFNENGTVIIVPLDEGSQHVIEVVRAKESFPAISERLYKDFVNFYKQTKPDAKPTVKFTDINLAGEIVCPDSPDDIYEILLKLGYYTETRREDGVFQLHLTPLGEKHIVTIDDANEEVGEFSFTAISKKALKQAKRYLKE